MSTLHTTNTRSALWLRAIDPLLWITQRQRVRHLSTFAQVERSSATDMRLAARLTPSPARAAMYLRHAADETRHTQLFLGHARQIAAATGLPSPATPHGQCEGLYERLGETAFLAFVHRAERRGREQFELHVRTLRRHGATELAAVFESVVHDELHHERYSGKLLEELAGSVDAAQREIRVIQRWELWRAFRRLGRHVSRALYDLSMRVMYLLCWPLRWLLPKPRTAQLSPQVLARGSSRVPPRERQ